MRHRLATIVLLAAACAPAGTDKATGDTGGTLLIALPANPNTLMPPYLAYAQEKEIADQVFDVLAEIGPGLNTQGDIGWTPRLATSWQWSPDSLAITFHLDPDARWHDGQPVTSNDIRFTVDIHKDPKVGSRFATDFAGVDSVATPDASTAVIWYRERSPEQFYSVVQHLLVMPEHLLRDADRANLAAHPYALNPVGSGPFRFQRWEARSVIEVVADTGYHMGRPRLDRVIWTLNPDINTALVKVLAGEADLLETVTPPAMAQIAGQQVVVALPYTNLNYGYLAFNMRDPANAERPHPLFGDRALRRALAMAIDRRALLKNVFDSLAFLGVGPFSHSLSTADTTLRMVDFDSAGASRLLDSLGWTERDASGIRRKSGRPLQFALSFPSVSAPRRRYAELIQAQLKAQGVKVDVDAGDISIIGEKLTKGRFDALLNNIATDPSPRSVRDSWHSTTPANRGGNFQLYGNPVVDAAIDSALAESNPTKARDLYRRAYQGIIDDVPAVWLYENRSFLALNRRVVPSLNADTWWRHLRLWSIPAAGRLPRDGN